jgi:hypothetical protein
MSYAIGTEVSIEKSQAEITALLVKAGAQQRLVGADDAKAEAYVLFRLADRHIRLTLPLPNPDEVRLARKPRGTTYQEGKRRAWDQKCRERWRAMLLLIRAKLEAVELGVSTIEREFLADIYLPDGRRVGETIGPELAAAYERGVQPQLLLGPAPSAPQTRE